MNLQKHVKYRTNSHKIIYSWILNNVHAWISDTVRKVRKVSSAWHDLPADLLQFVGKLLSDDSDGIQSLHFPASVQPHLFPQGPILNEFF
jgi:hypothetical protein